MSRRFSRCLDGLPFAALPLLASCVAPRVAEAPPAPPPPVVVSPLPQVARDWTDGPLTPGGWSYRADGAGTIAVFGTAGAPLFTLRCDPAPARIAIGRTGATASLTVTTTAVTRSFALAGGAPATLAPRDPFLDQMTFSRGRLLIRADALPPLVLPAYAEIGRVVEDCRA